MPNAIRPIHLNRWIKKNKTAFQPPVGNKEIWSNQEWITMVVAGPNARIDFHIDPKPEFFFQIKGTLNLDLFENNKIKKVQVKQGEIFMIPSLMPHRPIRKKNTLGLVIEQKRLAQQLDEFLWICPRCLHEVHRIRLKVVDIDKQLSKAISHFYQQKKLHSCKKCSTQLKVPVL